jgi:hypothetical protein
MATQAEKMHIISMLEQGKVNAAEAASLLDALTADDEVETAEDFSENEPFDSSETTEQPEISVEDHFSVEQDPPPKPPPLPRELRKWRNYWIGLFLITFGALVISAMWMYQAYTNSGYGFWFFCSWLPFMISVAAVALAWNSRTTPWLHLRVEQPKNEWPRRISFSFPLPLGLASWILHNFGHRIPGMDQIKMDSKQMDQLIFGLKDYTSPDNPLYIEVDEGDGERVFIYIG